ncbi:GNAT family N-acetyltransferase [Mucilaginibacter hurinus]|uniref:GNAT family N-acetyltransferase n=1 Tax=Mucilaginibacter hurinus TaxID=2201324 RepID=A0A367GUN3_9SPHI|nr:GNAT family protein [Mucilaginibacter hurinus]RCH56785.1 GNAT family N-acetyltransferase [Mucilaginibacter hurinus]
MVLNGNGFTLRTWKITDAETLQKNGNDTDVSDFLLDRFPSPYTLEKAVAFINSKINEAPAINFPIIIDEEVAGVIGLEMRVDVYRKTSLLGYWLSGRYRGRGIMPEAVKLITGYAFDKLDIICIQACVLSKNSPSMRVLEKAGYEKQGVLKQSVIKNNQVWDEHIYAIYK